MRLFSVGGDKAPHHAVGERQETPVTGADEIKYLSVGYPAELLRERIVLVDTPGVNDLSLQRADITYSYIPRSDAVLFLLDAGQPLKESERVFLQEKLLGQSRDKIVFVVTKRDIWDEDEQKQALGYIRTELGKLVKSPVVFAVSAEQALEGKLAGERDARAPHPPDALPLGGAREDPPRQRPGRGRGRRRPPPQGHRTPAAAPAPCPARSWSAASASWRRTWPASPAPSEERAAPAHPRRGRGGHPRRGQEGPGALRRGQFVRQIPEVIDSASGDEIKLHLGAFMEKTFTEWSQGRGPGRSPARQLEAVAEKTIALVREDAHDVAKRVGDALGGDMKAPDVAVDTFGYDVGVVALGALGLGVMVANVALGLVVMAAAPALAYFVRGKVEAETKKRAKEFAPQALREAAARVGPKLDEMILDFAARLDAWVVSAGEELHREVIEVLSATRTERAAQKPGVEASTKVCDEQIASPHGAPREAGGHARLALDASRDRDRDADRDPDRDLNVWP